MINKESMLKMMICYFKKIGYNDTVKSIEKESEIEIKNIFDEHFKKLFYKKNFEECYDYINKINFNIDKKNHIKFNLIKLKFLKNIVDNNIPIALIILRTELNEYPQFNSEVQILCSLLINKNDKELKDIIDFTSENSLREYFLKLENYILGNNYEEIFKTLLINDKKQQIYNCKYHYDEVDINLNNIHKCNNYKKFSCKNVIAGINNEIIWTKISKCEKYIAITYINNSFSILVKKKNNYEFNYKKDLKPEFEEINLIEFSENSLNIAIACSNFVIKIFLTSDGSTVKTIENAHEDLITGLSFCNNDTSIISSSYDNMVHLREINNSSNSIKFDIKKIKQIKLTNKDNIYFLSGFNKYIGHYIIPDKNEIEIYKDEIFIKCFDIDKDENFLIISRKTNQNEILLLGLENREILKVYNSDNIKLKNLCFIDNDNKLIISMAENGYIIFWHMNNSSPIQKINYDMNINSIDYINNKVLIAGSHPKLYLLDNN